MSIGANAAELDDEFLLPCFVRYPPVEQCLNIESRGMVIEGRTGSGKTAILKYIRSSVENSTEIDPFDMSMSYVSNSDVLNFLHAIGADLDLMFQVLWKHVLCIEFIRMRFSVNDETSSFRLFSWFAERFNTDPRKHKSIAYLKNWEGKFWITMDQNIRELTEKIEDAIRVELGAEVEKFKAGGQYDKRLSVDKKTEFISRVRKIINSDQLTELAHVIEMLAEIENESSIKTYYILIDRLDESWVDASLRFKLIRGLIESLKSFRKIRDLKVVVAARSDVLERVVQETKDLTFQREKLDDYFVHLKWSKLLLKQVVDNRMKTLFRKQYTQADITFDDVFTSNVSNVQPFDYIAERTFMRPRDIIAFVNECLHAAEGTYQVTATMIKRAELRFSAKRKDSIEQEWQSAYPCVKTLLNQLGSKKKPLLTLSELLPEEQLEDIALAIYPDNKIILDPVTRAARDYLDEGPSPKFAKTILSALYRIGACGVKLQTSTRYQFAYLDDPLLPVSQIPDDDIPIRIHPMLWGAFRIN